MFSRRALKMTTGMSYDSPFLDLTVEATIQPSCITSECLYSEVTTSERALRIHYGCLISESLKTWKWNHHNSRRTVCGSLCQLKEKRNLDLSLIIHQWYSVKKCFYLEGPILKRRTKSSSHLTWTNSSGRLLKFEVKHQTQGMNTLPVTLNLRVRWLYSVDLWKECARTKSTSFFSRRIAG